MHVTASPPQQYTSLSPPSTSSISSDSVMGCGASVMRPEDHPNNPFHYKLARPITEDSPKAPHPLPLNVPFFCAKAAADHGEVGVRDANKHAHAMPPSAVNAVVQRDERADAITSAASPSFREYCVVSRSSSDIEHSHDDPDTVETTDNTDNDDPMVVKSTPSSKEITIPKKEGEKKERKGSKLWDVINKGRAGGKKIGLVRHRSDNRAGRLT